ncbi:YihY/virulence factor BrkB family protein [Oscillospiraceae bacterium OttesenSCG-928-F05]|nr:YihY/virulence factor BrkB family protein [Oscillospiraceae bacterium OttesenSCG-928-F05]
MRRRVEKVRRTVAGRGKKIFARVRERALGLYRAWMKNPVFSAVVRYLAHLGEDDIVGVAAQTSFFLLLSIFPLLLLLTATLSNLSVQMDPDMMRYILPPSVTELLNAALQSAPPTSTMTAWSVVVAAWSSSTAVWALMKGISRAHTGKALYRPIWQRVAAIIFMAGFVAAAVLSLSLWFFGGDMIALLDARFGPLNVALLGWLRHAAAGVWVFIFLLFLYRYTPGVGLKFPALLPGTALATLGWMATTWLYDVYMANFNNYSLLYGSVGAFLGLALWALVISVVIIVGAELNAFLDLMRKRQK